MLVSFKTITLKVPKCLNQPHPSISNTQKEPYPKKLSQILDSYSSDVHMSIKFDFDFEFEFPKLQ
jgi:hypothetical protein